MPKNLFAYLNCSSKGFKALILLFLIPSFLNAQSLTGLWTGAISNDSSTVRKDQSFEIALTEYRGKVYGYSRSEFIVDDVLYYVVKRVKGTIEGDVCEVIDDEIISFNFPRKLDKGVKVTSTFKRNNKDSVWHLVGTWKTNATKKYYAVTGKVGLEEEKDLAASKIFPHLEELKLANDVAFYKERVEGIPVVKIAKPEKISTSYIEVDKEFTQSTGTAVVAKPIIIEPAIIKEEEKTEEVVLLEKAADNLPKTNTVVVQTKTSVIKSEKPDVKIALNSASKQTFEKAAPQMVIEKAVVKNTTLEKNKTITTNPSVVTKSVTTQTPPADNNKGNVHEVVHTKIEKQELKKIEIATPSIAVRKPQEEIIKSAAEISGRRSEFTQEVNYTSDSLLISLYDNGEIDGDTVSVYLNGEVLMYKQGLKASAIKKTIYVSPDKEDFSLVLFAENLGKYPPNTGLLVVHDGEDVYNLRFSSDFQKNSGIIFRRKNK